MMIHDRRPIAPLSLSLFLSFSKADPPIKVGIKNSLEHARRDFDRGKCTASMVCAYGFTWRHYGIKKT